MNKNLNYKGLYVFGIAFTSQNDVNPESFRNAIKRLLYSFHAITWCKEAVDSFKSNHLIDEFLESFYDQESPFFGVDINFTNYEKIESQKKVERLSRISSWVNCFGQLSVEELSEYCQFFNLTIQEAQKNNRPSDFTIAKTPDKIFEILSNDVIGQDTAKKTLAVELFNQYLRKQNSLSLNNASLDFPKSNIMLIGPSGSGKTMLARKCAEVMDVPFIKIDSASAVKSGIIGSSVTDNFQSAYCKLQNKEDLEYAIVLIDEFDKLAQNYAYDRSSIQNEILNIIGENGEVTFEPGRNEPKVKVSCKNMLFILCGAFQDLTDNPVIESTIGFMDVQVKAPVKVKVTRGQLVQFGFSIELINRIHKIIHLEKLTEMDFVKMLKESQKSPLIPYINLFKQLGKSIEFTDCFYEALACKAISMSQNGRGPASELATIMEDILFDIKNVQGKLIIDQTFLN